MMMPIQPVYKDDEGTVRFKQNRIVRFLLDAGSFDMNKLAMIPFPDQDREQFAMLIGYSLSGFAELPYTSDETYEKAEKEAEKLKEKPIIKTSFSKEGKESIRKIIKDFLESGEGKQLIISIVKEEIDKTPRFPWEGGPLL